MAVVVDVVELGAITELPTREILVVLGGPDAGHHELRVRTTETVTVEVGDSCQLAIDLDAITVWPQMPASMESVG